jgi:hypothetical protein
MRAATSRNGSSAKNRRRVRRAALRRPWMRSTREGWTRMVWLSA